MIQVTAKFLFKLPYNIQIKRGYGSSPQCKIGSGEIVIYPPAAYKMSLFEEPLWSPDPEQAVGEVNGEQVWSANCIPIHIRKDFTTIPITDEDQNALDDSAREILYKLLTLFRWRAGQPKADMGEIKTFEYALRYFDSENKPISIKPDGSKDILINLTVTLKRLKKPIEWNDICQDLIAGIEPQLYESLLLDASSVVSQDPRHAVLDAATACEVFIENFCETASKNNPQIDAEVYSALTQRAGVLSYFHEVVKYLFRHSLKEERTDLYKELDCLTRTNNSVKHEGLCQYKNDKGKVITVDSARATEFIDAVENAIQYVKSLGC